MRRNRYLFLLSLILVLPVLSQTPADTSEEAAVIEKFATHCHFNNDGNSKEEVTAAIRVQSEAGVQAYGQLILGYSSATEKLVVDYVRVRKPGGEVVSTPDANAQDFAPDILASAPMYSDFRERHITVVALRPGDVLEYHTTTTTVQPLAPGQFWFEYSFPKGTSVTEALLEIDVPKSRDIHLKSPKHKYTTTESGDFKTYSWSEKNLAPDRRKKEDSEGGQDEAEDQFADIQLSSFKDWQQLASWYAKLQGERVVVDENITKKAQELTRGAVTRKEKAQRLYDYVAREIRYVSLSFGEGRLQPHAAPEVLLGSYGDCKDKHTLLAALLRAVGIESYPVLIDSDRKLDPDVPSPAQFDHVITAARIENDKDLTFLDATAEVAPFGLIMYQLRDKQAVIAADAPVGGLHTTPASVPVKNSVAYSLDGKFSESGTFDATVDFSLNGDSAIPFRIIFRSTSRADWPRMVENLARFQGALGDISKVDVTALDDPYSPLHVHYSLHKDSYFAVPSEDDALLPFPALWYRVLSRAKRGETIDVGPATEVHNKAHLQFASNYKITPPLETRISREYGEFDTTYQMAKNVLDVQQDFILKVNKVPANRRSDVDSLRSVATDRATQVISCAVLGIANQPVVAVVPSNASSEELRKAAASLMQRSDFRGAADVLQRLVEKEPSDPDAWDNLGRAYSGLGDHANAVTAFRKQVEVNAGSSRAYDDLGAELQQMGKYEDAVSAYNKQLESNPTDRIARKNHALVLAELKRSNEAIGELEALAAAPPRDLDVDLALADLYNSSGNNEKAKALLETVIGSPTLPANGDIYSAALRDDIDPDTTVRDANDILEDIGEQFDEGLYKTDSAAALPAMQFVALQWARLGWADILKQRQVEGIRYLEAAWNLSQSSAVANRLARIYEHGGDPAGARRLLALAVAAGGADAQDSRARLEKLGGHIDTSKSSEELTLARTAKIKGVKGKSGRADFLLTFDGNSTPDRVEFREGDTSLRQLEEPLLRTQYPISFPDVSSVKIVRRGTLTCQPAGCQMLLKPLEPIALKSSVGNTQATNQSPAKP